MVLCLRMVVEEIKLPTLGIFLTGLTRPESKMKLRKNEKGFGWQSRWQAGRASERELANGKRGLGRALWTPCWKPINLRLSVWRIGPLRHIVFACGRCLPGSCTSGGAFGRVGRVWIGAQHQVDGDEKKPLTMRSLKAGRWGATPVADTCESEWWEKKLRNRKRTGCWGGRRWEVALFIQSETVRACLLLWRVPPLQLLTCSFETQVHLLPGE